MATAHFHFIYAQLQREPDPRLPPLPPLHDSILRDFRSQDLDEHVSKSPRLTHMSLEDGNLTTTPILTHFSFSSRQTPTIWSQTPLAALPPKSIPHVFPICSPLENSTSRYLPTTRQRTQVNNNQYSYSYAPQSTSAPRQKPQIPSTHSVQIIIFSLNSHRYYHHSPFPQNVSTIRDLLHLTPVFKHIPTYTRLTYKHSPLPIDSSISILRETIAEISVLCPILGGADTTIRPSSLLRRPNLPNSPLRRLHKTKLLTRQGYTIRVATFNCNGCIKNNSFDRHKLLWNFVSNNKIDVLFLIDHRTSLRSLTSLKNMGSNYLQTDIRLIATDITLLHRPSCRSTPLYDYHATVGGCAILTFGSIAHITFPSSFVDPSGAATFVGAKLIPHSSLPPVFLNAIYLFPPSQGPTTLNSRISDYLKTINHSESPCQWQRNLISSLLKEQYDSHPNCAQIVGGDFNHRNWDIPDHPVTHTFLSDLQLSNSAFDAVHSDTSNIPTPVTFLSTNTWIDHILHSGRSEINDFCDYSSDLVTTYSDHAPYSNDIYIHLPTTHYNIPNNLLYRAKLNLRATHIRKSDTISKERYQALCIKHMNKLTPNQDNWTPIDHETYYEQLGAALVKMAKSSTKHTLRTSMPKCTNWSPDLHFLYKFIKLIKRLLSSFISNPSTQVSTAHILQRISNFLAHHYNIYKTVDNISLPRYHTIIHKLYPTYPLLTNTSSCSDTPPRIFLQDLLSSCKRLCHVKHQKEMRMQINKRIKALETARAKGKLKQVITWILERESSQQFTQTVTSTYKVKPIPREAHDATTHHFTNHFSCHPWITQSKLNDPGEQGQCLRHSLLQGTWRQDYPQLTHTLDNRHRQFAAAYFDTFAYKANPQQRQALQQLSSLPITFDSFYKSLLQRCGTKSPGPSGLTISILQSTPIPILQHLHGSLSTMWASRHIPKSWQSRELALLPKKPNSTTLAEMRPLMLLEVHRKTWLSLILKPIAIYLHEEALLCPYQVGGIPNSGTEDAILQLINALEDSSERAENIEILAFDKAKAFDSPGRLSGISLAWQRMGVPSDIATYIANCDNSNLIFPRTPYYLSANSKHPKLAFHAAMGTPQGCSSASLSYLVVEDIILSTFQSCLHTIDPYLAQDPTGILFQQPPTQFVDDTYVFCRTTQGAQTAINLLQTAEPLLNIRINPSKTRHFSLHWSPPKTNSSPFFSLDTPTSTLYACNPEGE